MRILLVCTATKGGGAAHATRRLFETLKARGAEVRLLSLWGDEDLGGSSGTLREDVAVLGDKFAYRLRGVLYKALERAEIFLYKRGDRLGLWRLSTARFGFDLSEHPWVGWADVIHLHWINHGLLSLESLERLGGLGKPIVYTLHDLWASSGICHLPFLFSDGGARLCPRYALGCGSCPLLGDGRERDASSEYLERKLFLRSPAFRFVAVSRREADYFTSSYLFATHKQAEVIPPPLDLKAYTEASLSLSLESTPEWWQEGRYYLLLSASRLDDFVKGAHLLRKIFEHFARIYPTLVEKTSLVLAGNIVDDASFVGLPVEVIRLGSIASQGQMARLYAQVSLTLSTSLVETFGQTLTESLASGTPVISFRSGGPEDIVRYGENGYLVDAYDAQSYAHALAKALGELDAGRWTREAIQASVRPFDGEVVAQAHLDLYERLLGNPSVV